MMERAEGGPDGPIHPRELASSIACEASAISDRRRWVGLEAIRYREPPPAEVVVPPLTHHTLVLFLRTPSALEVQYDGAGWRGAPRAGSIAVVPSGSRSRWRWSGPFDSLHVFLEPRIIARVASGSFGLDPARISIPPLDGLDLPQLRDAMMAVDAELAAEDAGGRLAVECLANIMAVHLLRHISAPRRLPSRGADGPLSRRKLGDVVAFIEGNLDAGLSVGRMAAVAHLSPYHFIRQFKAATGVTPHQYVIARRVERAKRLLLDGDLSLLQVAARAGFSDQSRFTHLFKRIVGATPGQFRRTARFA
jgi:AraC family transcriptional regulator